VPVNDKVRSAAVLGGLAAVIIAILSVLWLRFTGPEAPVSLWAWRALWYVILPIVVIVGFRSATKKIKQGQQDQQD